ncbi:MAG: flagellar motor switch protein FliM [Chloroflexota bacterium]
MRNDNKILSQTEIEALLAGDLLGGGDEDDAPASFEDQPEAAAAAASASQDGEIPFGAPVAVAPPPPVVHQKPAKLYDFRRPDKFSKEHLRSLRILHESFARMLGSSLTSYLSAGVQVRLTMLEQGTYDEYIQSLPTPTVIYVVGLAPLPGQAVVELNLPVARVLIDRLLGGTGSPAVRSNEMTEIELALLKTIGQFILSSLRETWSNVVPLRPSMQEPVLSPELAQFATMAEATVMLVLEVSVFKSTGTISMCIPYQVLQPVLDSLTSQVWFGGGNGGGTTRGADADSRNQMGDRISQVSLPVTVELGDTELTVQALLDLQIGHVLRLNTNAQGPLPIRVDDRVKFVGQAGLSGKNLAVQIVHAVAQEG